MKFILLNIIYSLGVFASPPHAVYVSVCNIKFNEEKNTVSLSYRMFSNDLEEALMVYSGELDKYLLEKVQLEINRTPVEMEYDGFVVEGDGVTQTTTAQFFIRNVDVVEQINISTTVLTEIYDTQTTIVNAKVGGKKKILNLGVRRPSGELRF